MNRWYLDTEEGKWTYIWRSQGPGLALWYVKTEHGWRPSRWRQNKEDTPLQRNEPGVDYKELTEEEVFLQIL